MAVASTLATIATVASIGLGAVGTAVQVRGANAASKAQQKAEKARKAQMRLEADRERRNIIREAQMARAVALSNATSEGAEDGSGLQGGYGQISGRAGSSIVGVNAGEKIGSTIFNANAQQARANGLISTGQGVTGLGSFFGQFGSYLNNRTN